MTELQPEPVATEPVATEPVVPDPAAGVAPAGEPTSADKTDEESGAVTAPAPVGATFRVMDVEDVGLELPAQYPSVTLVEMEPPRRDLVFPIGLPEGTALALALRRMESRRPMTHELFMQVLQRAHIDVIAVRLVGREDGNLLAELDLMTPAGRECVDCRPSDGLVLALRMPVPAPILVDERLLDTLDDVAPAPKATAP
jgi:uncharacterized protein